MIKIEVIGVVWEPGKEALGFASKKSQRKFEDWVAKEYIKLLKKSVDDQRHKAKWAPLSPAYLSYKRENNLSLKTWEATGELVRNLKFKSNRTIGFDNRKKHNQSNETYLQIARKLEYGNLGIPARPLFRLVYWYMRKNISFFIKRYLKEVGR